ncbi:hypothetical protein HRE53_25500 [Acaryochloris sp. 'Moss Beach']|uniref:hypothetical protein n=1 Tax=Acaryochloris sp. 'Moss Beach' TaxID=2740837 RepID=UPI001F292859|nr:hypothetical protein [Acaryochloris sp. 'Moss Beach']UJB69620.1 hypothetical protein HRE53_25500 [Acaryochloris sp. 'Moss Beach']
MILPLYQPHLRRQLSPAQYLLLEILVHLLQTLRCVKIETLAEGLPLPILFDSRRKKIQRFLSLPTLELETLWLPLVKLWLSQQYPQGSQLYVVIDRTSWGVINLLMVSVVWQHRAIPVWCEALCKKGSSNYDEQTAVLSKVIRHLSAYRLVILGDREFCSVKLGAVVRPTEGLLLSATQAQYRSGSGPAVYSTTPTVWPCPRSKAISQ